MATPSTTHGAFSWNELTTSDAKAARKFYGSLLGSVLLTISPSRQAKTGRLDTRGIAGESAM